MEVAGLAVGGVGLAGLISSVVDLLNYVSAAGRRDEDYESLQDIFEFERGRFVLWAEMYNNLGGNDGQPQTPHGLLVDSLIENTLRSMRRLITDAEGMMERYGLNRLDPSTSRALFKPISRVFPNLSRRLVRKKNTLPHPIRWAIRDRERFRALVYDMTLLNNRFDSLNTRYRLEHDDLVLQEISSCSDHHSIDRITVAYQGNDISDVVSQRRSTLEDEACRIPADIDGHEENVRSLCEVIYGRDLGLAEVGQHFDACDFYPRGTEYIEEYLEDILENSLLLVPQRPEKRALIEVASMNGLLIYHLRAADMSHCENVLANLQQHQSVGLQRRLKLELLHLTQLSTLGPIDPMRACTMAPIGDNPYEWRAVIEGPAYSPYEGGIFCIRFRVPREYPMEPLHWNFETRIYHPNISTDSGETVPGLLDLIPQNRPWCADETFLRWILKIRMLLKTPSPDQRHAIEQDIAEEFTQAPASFNQTAKEWTRIYANPETQTNMFLTPKYEVPKPSETLVQLECFLSQATEACSLLHAYVTGAEPASPGVKASIRLSLSGLLSEIHSIRNSRYIDVVGGEEFARHAANRLMHVSEKMMLVHHLNTAIMPGPKGVGEAVAWYAVAEELKALERDVVKWRVEIEEGLAVQAYEDSRFFRVQCAFEMAGFQDCKEQASPSAKLPFPLLEA